MFLAEFADWAKKDPKVNALITKAWNNDITYKDAQKLASMSGKKLGEMMALQLSDGGSLGSLDMKMLRDVLNKSILANYNLVTPVINQAQLVINRALNVQLNPIIAKFPRDRVRGLAKEIEERGVDAVAGQLPKQVENISVSTVDDSMKENVRFMGSVGFRVTVSRYYDHVGVNHRKEACQWCLDRCGVNVPYREALEKGMFERHPGCGCILDYTSEKGTQRQVDWTRNQWV